MPEETTKLSDEQVAALGKVFSIQEPDAAKLREQVVAKLAEAAKAETPPEPTPPAPTPPAPTPTEPAPTGDAAVRAMAERIERMERDHHEEKRDALLTPAVGKKFEAAELDNWRAFYDANPQLAERQLAALPDLPASRTYGLDDLELPGDMDAEAAEKAGEELFARYAAATGVARGIVTG